MNENPNIAIRLQGVTKSFGSGRAVVHALRGIDMTIKSGELVMLVGPSGCGKTTLVSIMSGVLDAGAGVAEAFGVDWGTLNAAQKTRRRGDLVGFIFQQFNLIPTLTAAENVSVPLLVRGVDRREAQRRSEAALTEVGLGDRVNALPGEFSGGMQQRVAIARALVGRPRLLICDEPTASLDGHTGQQVMELIKASAHTRAAAAGAGRCVVVVTHDTRIFHYADRIEEMEDGRLKPRPSQHVIEEAKIVPHYDSQDQRDDEAVQRRGDAQTRGRGE